MWVIAAPALAAPTQALAICSGVQGRPGCCCSVVWLPVTAQLRIVLLLFGFVSHLRLRATTRTFGTFLKAIPFEKP